MADEEPVQYATVQVTMPVVNIEDRRRLERDHLISVNDDQRVMIHKRIQLDEWNGLERRQQTEWWKHWTVRLGLLVLLGNFVATLIGTAYNLAGHPLP